MVLADLECPFHGLSIACFNSSCGAGSQMISANWQASQGLIRSAFESTQ